MILPCLQNDDVQGLQNEDIQKTVQTPYHPSRKARNQYTEVLPMILPCLQNMGVQGLQNKDIQKREGQPASIRVGNLLTEEVTPMIPQGLQKGDIQETDHIKKNAKNVDKSCNSHESTMSLEWRYAKDSLNAFSSEHKTKKSVDKTSHECSHKSTRSPEQRSSKDRNPVSFENQKNDSSYFQVSKSNNGSVSRNLDSSNNFETVIANDKSKDTLLLISRNCDSSRSIESVLPNENSRNREFSINHVSGNFTHDAQSVPQNQKMSHQGEILIQRDRSMKLCYQKLSNQSELSLYQVKQNS